MPLLGEGPPDGPIVPCALAQLDYRGIKNGKTGCLALARLVPSVRLFRLLPIRHACARCSAQHICVCVLSPIATKDFPPVLYYKWRFSKIFSIYAGKITFAALLD